MFYKIYFPLQYVFKAGDTWIEASTAREAIESVTVPKNGQRYIVIESDREPGADGSMNINRTKATIIEYRLGPHVIKPEGVL